MSLRKKKKYSTWQIRFIRYCGKFQSHQSSCNKLVFILLNHRCPKPVIRNPSTKPEECKSCLYFRFQISQQVLTFNLSCDWTQRDETKLQPLSFKLCDYQRKLAEDEAQSGISAERERVLLLKDWFGGHGQKASPPREEKRKRESTVDWLSSKFVVCGMFTFAKRDFFASTRNWWKSGFERKARGSRERNEKCLIKRWFWDVNRLSFNEPLETIGCSKKCKQQRKVNFPVD